MKKFLSTALSLSILVAFTGCTNTPNTEITESIVEVQVPDISYEDARVSFLGPEGTYTQEACEVFFDGEGEYLAYTTVADAVAALVAGESDYAVIPQENTIGGAVIDYVDTLIGNGEVSVAGEIVLTINQNLLVMPGTTIDEIHTVYSHAQGLTQGRAWLEENLPDAEIVEVSSTAEGARMVSENGDSSCAAIASAGCADVYDLEVLAASIQNNDNNRTRFYVLTTDEPCTYDSDRIAFIASGSANILPGLMSSIDAAGAELIAVHDRPLRTELGQYSYVIECSGLSYEDYVSIEEASSFEFRFLGCFTSR